MADYRGGTDLLDHFVKSQRSRDTDVLWAMYEASAATAVAGVDRARRRGVTVVKRAVLATSRDASSSSRSLRWWRTGEARCFARMKSSIRPPSGDPRRRRLGSRTRPSHS
jgi:hypothetical protein